MVWPVLAAGLFAVGERSILRWTALGAAAAAGLSQYFLILETLHHPLRTTPPGLHDPRRFVDLLGRPFGNDLAKFLPPQASYLSFGSAGLVLLAVGVFLSRGRMRERLPGLLVACWGLLAALQIGYLRPEAAPWYAVPMTAFWMGLALVSLRDAGTFGEFGDLHERGLGAGDPSGGEASRVRRAEVLLTMWIISRYPIVETIYHVAPLKRRPPWRNRLRCPAASTSSSPVRDARGRPWARSSRAKARGC